MVKAFDVQLEPASTDKAVFDVVAVAASACLVLTKAANLAGLAHFNLHHLRACLGQSWPDRRFAAINLAKTMLVAPLTVVGSAPAKSRQLLTVALASVESCFVIPAESEGLSTAAAFGCL